MRFTITKKIALAYFVVIILMIIIAVAGIVGLNTTSSSVKRLEKDSGEMKNVFELQTQVANQLMDANNYLLTAKKNYLTQYNHISKVLNKSLNKLDQYTLTDSEVTELKDIQRQIDSIHVESKDIFAIKHFQTDPKASLMLEDMNLMHGTQIYKDLTSIFDSLKVKVRNETLLVEQKKTQAYFIISGTFFLVLLVAFTVVFLTMKKISKRILDLVAIAQRISAHDFSVELKTEAKDEIGMLIIAFNAMISEIKKRYEELESFAHIVAHDLKSPVAGIIGSAEVMTTEFQNKLNEEEYQFFDNIMKSAKNMVDLINDLLQFALAGKVEFTKEPVSVNRMVEEIEEDIKYLLKEKNASLIIKDKLPDLICDPVQLSQVWKNLITNSVKYNDKKAPSVEAGYFENAKYPGMYCFYVRDNGIGIDKSYFERIFMPFQRATNDLQYKGTGIGLAIVKRVVEYHGGRVWVESTIGEGTTFYFTIPKPENFSVQAIKQMQGKR